MEGKNSEGIYTPQIYLQTGLRKSSELLSKIINRNGGYVNPDCMGYEFTSAQVKFLSGEAFMMCNGDWLDKEADKHYKPGEVDVKFMKPPVISDILYKLPKGSIKDDATLRKVVDYVDDSVADDVEESDKTPKPLGIDDEDIEYVRQAKIMFIFRKRHTFALSLIFTHRGRKTSCCSCFQRGKEKSAIYRRRFRRLDKPRRTCGI